MSSKTVYAAIAALSLCAAACSLTGFAWIYGKARAYEKEHGVSIFSPADEAAPAEENGCSDGDEPDDPVARAIINGTSANESGDGAKSSGADKKASSQCATNAPAPAQMKVLKVDYDKETEIRVVLSERPEMSGIRQYVGVEPLNGGFISVSYDTDYDSRKKKYIPVLVVSGDFAHRTDVTLRIRKGLALYGKASDPEAKGALAEDFTYTFRRKDLEPYVAFASDGRYLPPGGKRAVVVESVNVPEAAAEIRRVEPDNVVQLLAREEGKYRCYYGDGGDSADTVELSGVATVASVPRENAPNKKELWNLPVRVEDGRSANGVFLVAVGKGGKPFCSERWRKIDGEWTCSGDWYNPPTYRLVCVSDFGLSVRKSGPDGAIGVWTVSLSSGRPVPGVCVEVYSASNVKVMEGVSDGSGWCRPGRIADGEPFAVVVRAADGSDMTFMALSSRMHVDETHPDGVRDAYLAPKESAAFLWTERGIYRHGEKILVHALFRDGTMKAPEPFPVALELLDPDGKTFAKKSIMPDALGSAVCDAFAVPDERPSGTWTVRASIPGPEGRVLGEREVRIEEFAPPQIRVTVEASESVHPSNFTFSVSAEHLFGGPAANLRCEGAVVFEDVPFAPSGWKGYSFGNCDLGLSPNYRELAMVDLDGAGQATFKAPIFADTGRPKAAVRAIGQGTVFEDGGRPATARKSVVLHAYPYYIGARLSSWLRLPRQGQPKVSFACVTPDGKRAAPPKALEMKIERIDSIYSCRSGRNSADTWDCERIRTVVVEGVRFSVAADADTAVPLPLDKCGDYALTVTDPDTGVSFGSVFYLSSWGDDSVRAPLADPAKVSIRADKSQYRVGESPRLVVKSPFPGAALLSVMRDKERYTEVLNLTNATSEVVLRPVTREDAPNLDVFISVVQSAEAGAKRLAMRAHGQMTVVVRPKENEIPVDVSSRVEFPSGAAGGVRLGPLVTVDVTAPGAEEAVVALVDEGINILTGEPIPDPVGRFGEVRSAEHPLYDLYGKMLPVLDGGVKAGGVKTGGGFGAEMLGRVSPVGSRRFKPLALWKTGVKIADGRGRVEFRLPEFAGEVRVTAVAYGAASSGAAAHCSKVAPRLVAMPDAPRFTAPGDVFEATLPVRNTTAEAGTVEYSVGQVTGRFELAAGVSTNISVAMTAPRECGTLAVAYRVSGLGEVHEQTIELPVRPAAPWVETCGVCPESEWKKPTDGKWSARTFDSPLGGYEAALRWLAEYPHGCLEQTVSRVFPLVAAGGLLKTIVTNDPGFVEAGVARVVSMVRENDFTMWPDCRCPPWSREVSVYAAHFLVEAGRAGVAPEEGAYEKVLKFLGKWIYDKDREAAVYALLVLAKAGRPDRDVMFHWYDQRKSLPAISRARLSLAFAEIGDVERAKALLAESFEPQSVKEAAFTAMALVRLSPQDPRILPLVRWLDARRDRERFSWGTTEENAHALVAIGTYFQARPPKKGEKFVSWRRLSLPDVASIKDESEGIFLSKRYLKSDGTPADLANIRCGDLIVAELSITSSVTRTISDLVVEDLLPGCFEPVHREPPAFPQDPAVKLVADWTMRKDVRDDRVLVFSKKFKLEAGHEARTSYPVRAVSAGAFVLPGASVEGMYDPRMHSRRAPGRVVVRH